MKFTKIIHVLINYDKKLGLQAHLAVETDDLELLGDKVVAVDLGETKSIRPYWNKVWTYGEPPVNVSKKVSAV